MKKQLLLVAVYLLTLSAYWWGNRAREAEETREFHSVASNPGGSGLSLFEEYLKTNSPGGFEVFGGFLPTAKLSRFDTLLILAPVFAPAKPELNRLEEFVAHGGRIILSFHNFQSENAAREILNQFKQTLKTREYPEFNNGTPLTIHAEKDLGPFRQGLAYSFYSSRLLDEPGCKKSASLACFYREFDFIDGSVSVFNSLAPVANGLLFREQNAEIARTILRSAGRLLLLESFHFFSDKTLWDAIKNPVFSLPLLGVLLLFLLFLLFGYTPFYERSSRKESTRVKSIGFHEFNERVIRRFLANKKNYLTASRDHAAFLRRLFPLEKRMLPETSDPEKLLAFHHQILKKKGKQLT